MSGTPTLRSERQLMRSGHVLVAGIDEVGRGAIAGPVSVGVVVVSSGTRSAPPGLRDSKLLTPQARLRLVPLIVRWAPWHAVGHAACTEIDRWGLTAALRLAAMRALALCPVTDVAILDGTHDWLSKPGPEIVERVPWPDVALPHANVRIKADVTCSSVAAASVLAKVERDDLMAGLDAQDDRYAWARNKGYTTLHHADRIREHGLSRHHRQSWNIRAAVAQPVSPQIDVRDPRVEVPGEPSSVVPNVRGEILFPNA